MEQRKKLVLKALPFTIIDGKLYKQREDQSLRQCLHDDKIFGNHTKDAQRSWWHAFSANIIA
jgi:hypothetical protein